MSTDVDQLFTAPEPTLSASETGAARVFVPNPSRSWLRGIAVVLLRPGRNLLSGIGDYFYDLWRFVRFSSAITNRYNAQQLTSLINKHYHNVEKGLALPEPRPGFGKENISRLMALVTSHEHRFGSNCATWGARDALAAYVTWHQTSGYTFPEIETFLAAAPDRVSVGGGTIAIDREELLRHSAIDFANFARHRYSIRQYTGEPIDGAELRRAVAVAAKTPSVCNRSTCKVHAILSPEKMRLALSYQNGNRGFGHLAGAILIVTSDMRSFVGFDERNQCWVDGGLFAMSLNYALHAQGYGVCMLNWSAPAKRDRAMRKALNIPGWEAVITMMAVGHVPEQINVAASPRRPAHEFIEIVH